MIEPVAKVLRGSLKADWRDRLEAARADIRDLSFGLPLRVGYELSKQVGTHGLVFGALERRTPQPAPMPTFRAIGAVPEEAQARTLEAADRIVDGEIVLFGKALPSSATTPWDAYIEKPGHWARDEWWKLDIRSASRDADVKWTWELGRQRHLVVLARAAHLRTERMDYRRALLDGITSFMEQAPPERGIHWYSNLEIALRILRWQEILQLVDVGSDLRHAMLVTLAHARRHLIADLPYTVSTMRNNHLLGDTLGVLATSAPGERDPTSVLARRLFTRQLTSELRADGSLTEDSVSYHRFVLEMLAWRLRVPGQSKLTRTAAVRAAQYLARLGALEGEVPQFGDWDEGRVFCVAGDARPVGGSVAATLALAGDGATKEWRQRWDECAWYAPEGDPVAPDGAVTDGSDVGGGIGRAAVGPFTVWLKAGSGPWHGHADLCSVAIRTPPGWLVGDPGTATYNGDPRIRASFRSTAVHSSLLLGGNDQLHPHRAFRWRRTAQGAIGNPIHGNGWTLMWGAHNAYRFMNPPRRVARTVFVSGDLVAIADWVEGPPGVEWSIAVPLGPATTYDRTAGRIMSGGTVCPIQLPGRPRVRIGVSEPPRGYWSETYGSWEPSTQLYFNGKYHGAVLWALGNSGESVGVVGNEVRVGALRWQVRWTTAGPVLYKTPGNHTVRLALRVRRGFD